MLWRRKIQHLNPFVGILAILFIFLIFQGYISWFSNKNVYSSNTNHEKITTLNNEIQFLQSVLRQHNVAEEEYNQGLLPVIYIITPTYARPQQKAELIRLQNIFLLVPSIHWIIVEDNNSKTALVSGILKKSGLPHTHLNIPTPQEWKLRENDPSWYKPRGVLQRNEGIDWLRKNIRVKTASGVVYFADDDNTYSTQLFKEMRWTKKVSVWPVGLVGGVMVERPKVSGRQVIGWLTAWRPDRTFATDMAGFAVNLSLLLLKDDVYFSLNSKRGFMENDFLSRLVTVDELEPKADKCTKVYVWHTRTEKPNLSQENLLLQRGERTDTNIEV